MVSLLFVPFCHGITFYYLRNISPVHSKIIIIFSGGTVGITIHEVLKNGNVQEVAAASGGATGGIDVNAAFKCLLIELWGDKFIKTLEEDTSLSRLWLGVEQSFDRAKKTASPSHREDKINVFTVAAQMYNKYQKTCGANILQNSENNDKLGVLFD